jgi:type I restriction enzyme S subunit
MREDWNTHTLGQLLHMKYGKMPKKEDLVNDGYPVFSGYRIVGYHKEYHYENSEIIVVARGVGGAGDIKLSPPFAYITNLSIVLSQLSDEVDKKFLYYKLTSTTLRDLRTGAAQAQIIIADLEKYKITIPPLPTQRKIAAILSAYDDLIENNTRRIQILEEMSLAIYREWFVKFKYPGHEEIPLDDSGTEFGEIPEGWVIVKLIDACEITMGQSPKSKFYNDTGEGLPFHQGVTNFGSLFPTDKVYCSIEKRIAHSGDILVSVRAPVGRMNLATKKMVIGRGLCAIRSKNDCQTFTYYQLKERFREEDTMGGGTIYKSVTKDDMHNIEFLLPTQDRISAFEGITQTIIRELQVLTEKNNILFNTRDLLLPKLVSGQVDVTQLEIMV